MGHRESTKANVYLLKKYWYSFTWELSRIIEFITFIEYPADYICFYLYGLIHWLCTANQESDVGIIIAILHG